MGSAERYEIAPITLQYGVGPTDLDLAQMQNFQLSPNITKSRVRAGGSVDALAFIVSRGRPQVTFGTRDLATYFGQVSPTLGLPITGDAIFREFERDEDDIWTGNGMTYTAGGGGFLIPQSLSASIDGPDGAVLTSMFLPYWDGTNLPLVAAEGSMSGAPTVAFGSQFFLGPVYHNSTEIRGITQSSVDFGLTLSGAPLTPGPYDRSSAITDRQPVFSFTTHKSNVNTDLFGAGVNTNLSLYFQKGSSNSDRVATTTSEHLKVSCTAGFIEIQETGGEAGSDAMRQILVSPIGTIAISIASTIP